NAPFVSTGAHAILAPPAGPARLERSLHGRHGRNPATGQRYAKSWRGHVHVLRQCLHLPQRAAWALALLAVLEHLARALLPPAHYAPGSGICGWNRCHQELGAAAPL